MKKYIFLTGQLFPNPGAPVLCLQRVVECLIKRGENVSEITTSDKDHHFSYEGINMFEIKAPRYVLNDRSSKFSTLLSRFSKLVHLRNYPLRSMKLVKKYTKIVKSLINKEDEFYIMASFMPAESVYSLMNIARKLKDYKNIKYIYYSADSLSNERGVDGIFSGDSRTARGIKLEKRIFSICDLIFVMECHEDFYFSNEFKEFHSKMRLVNFPFVVKPKEIEKKNDGLQMAYIGSLYRKLRNPSYLLDVLSQVHKEIPFNVKFAGGGDSPELLKEYCESHDFINFVKYLGHIDHDRAEYETMSADYLLSIGNDNSPMMPSKIYEYVSTGKPIIHVYTYDKDPVLDVLKTYGNALLIKKDECDFEKLKLFLKTQKQIPFEKVAKLFERSTPDYTVRRIDEL